MQRLPHIKQPLEVNYYTPTSENKVAVMRFREWIEVHPYEVILAHKSHEPMLFSYGFKRCKGVTVYRTQKQALKANRRRNLKGTITE